MQSQLDIHYAKINRQQQIMEHYEQRIEALEQTIEDMKLKSRIDVSQKANQIKDDIAEEIHANIAIHKSNVRQHRLVLDDDGTVAFHAVIKMNVEHHIGIGQKIVFPDVMINLGGGYRNQHGIFNAPPSGLYLFSTSIMSYSAGHVEIYVHLIKNENIMSNVYAHGDSGRHDQGSVTVVTQLDVGDEVWVSLYGPADTSLWGEYYDSFMGYLIVPM